MKKPRVISLTICILFIFTIIPIPSFANTTIGTVPAISYCVITNSGVLGTSFSPEAKLQICYKTGQVSECSLDNSVSINGTNYSCSTKDEMETVLAEIPLNSFAKLTIRSGEVTSVYFDNTPESYTDVTYNTETNQFSNVPKETLSLPVYYGNFKDMTAPYLDENHKYTIDLYDYGIHITKMTAINADQTVERMDINFAMNSNFLQNIFIYCETTDENSMIKAELYTNDCNLFRESFTPATEEAVFIDVPNDYNNYIVKLYMTDENENKISHLYTKEIQTAPINVHYLTVINKMVLKDSWGKSTPLLLLTDSSGTEYTAECTKNCIIDGVRYSTAEDIIANIPLNKLYKLSENEDGKITVISQYDKMYGEFSDVACENNTLHGNIMFFQVAEEFNLVIALYDEDVLVDVSSFNEPSNVSSQSFEFTVEADKEYNLKAFFINKTSMIPLGDCATWQ